VASNHCSFIDSIPFLTVKAVHVLMDKAFYGGVASTFQKVVGAFPIDQTDTHVEANRQRLRESITSHLKHTENPLLFFPEGWDTKGDVGLLMFNKFLFSLDLPVVPVSLRVHIPFLPLSISVLGTQLWKEVLWFLFYPCAIWDLHFLSVQKINPSENAEQFARRVQVLIASDLGVCATSYFNKEALAFRKTLLGPDGPKLRSHYTKFHKKTN